MGDHNNETKKKTKAIKKNREFSSFLKDDFTAASGFKWNKTVTTRENKSICGEVNFAIT